MIEIYKKIYSLLDARERRRGAVVFGLMIFVAFVETIGVASIMPFIAVLANPAVVEENQYLAWVYKVLGFSDNRIFLIFLGAIFFFVLLASLTTRALGIWAQLRFSQNRNASWSSRLVGGYLGQPYEWFLNRHSSDLATNVLAEVQNVINGVLFPSMQVIAHGLIALFLFSLLLVVDPFLAVSVSVALGGGFLLISLIFKRKLERIGKRRRIANLERFHIVQEGFGGIKEAKVLGLERELLKRFRGPAQMFADCQISTGTISQLPPLAMQALLFGGMLLVLLYLMVTMGGFQSALPVIALYALAGYRLMPALQHIYQGISQMRATEAVLDQVCTDFERIQVNQPAPLADERPANARRTPLLEKLTLHEVSYRYPGAAGPALRNLSLSIPAFTTVGLVGTTGSGKTTAVDIILGLLRPSEGALVVDGAIIGPAEVRRWQRTLGYVPQQIFLSDETVAGNIAFGLPEHAVDMDAVERAARVANLHDFVVNEMPEGYQTRVGERGVRLSGGQRQRIGIARALYHDPDVLILDEATSALDNLTEQAVMEAVDNLGSGKTIILIAHRLSTVRNCDCIYMLERGALIAAGTYDELMVSSSKFRTMAEAV